MMKRIAKILIMTAALAAMLSLITFAAEKGLWDNSNGRWRYLENGVPVTNEWRTDAQGDYFYLGGDGFMAVSSFIDDDRYVDNTGRMVRGKWIKIEDKWHYFETTGRMVVDKKKQISGQWYFFDESGCMITGWHEQDGEWYYCDESAGGSVLTAVWKKLEPAPEMEISQAVADVNDGSYWFYFQNNGKAAKASADDFKEVNIGGTRYAFDRNGIMQTGWIRLSETDPVIAGYKYYNNDKSLGIFGAAHEGWLSAYAPEGMDSGEVQWYYFDSHGTPAYGTKVVSNDGTYALEAVFKKITKNGTTYTYLFNEKGNPVYGLVQVRKPEGGLTSMYFGSKSQSCLQKASGTITEGDGSSWKYAFTSAGYGITGVHNGYLYYKGKAQKAIDDKHSFYKVDNITYLVNANGALVKNYNKSKASEDVEYKSDASGIKSGGTAATSELIEPEYQEQE